MSSSHPTDMSASENPPPYAAATAGAADATSGPRVRVTGPQGVQSSNNAEVHNLERVATNETVSTVSSDGLLSPGLVDEEGRKSMDDERRDLPKGWVRCFDPKSEHHYYVDEATKRSIWIHPYDDPEYLSSLPDEHPANPKSQQAQQVRELAQREQAVRAQPPRGEGNAEERNWFQRKKDKLIGTKEERDKAKEEKRRAKEEQRRRMREAEQEYIRRRRELIQQQLNDPSTRRYYASNPYGYAAPSVGFSRAGGMYGSPYGYGYGGGYGRRYGYGGGMGGMGMGMPLFGGLAGGMLLGSALGGGFGGGYGDCGGGFDGGGGGGDGGGGM